MVYNSINKFDDPEHEALLGVWWSGLMLKGAARRFFRDKPTSDAQFNVMLLLKYADHPMTQKELSERLLVDKSNLTGLVDRMERVGHLRRVAVPSDRRCYHLELTPAGTAVLELVEGPYRELVRSLMADFEPEELKILTALMGKLQKSLEKKIN